MKKNINNTIREAQIEKYISIPKECSHISSGFMLGVIGGLLFSVHPETDYRIVDIGFNILRYSIVLKGAMMIGNSFEEIDNSFNNLYDMICKYIPTDYKK
ncbi:hypothetical protein FP803_03505 [Candidatus Woesearchaeota archaeon]|nr:hypothetical protein [Candidatus Woesearchaeota archaeon]MBU3941949.1 hypothetical protein [Nanoarchaeota archaeon]